MVAGRSFHDIASARQSTLTRSGYFSWICRKW